MLSLFWSTPYYRFCTVASILGAITEAYVLIKFL